MAPKLSHVGVTAPPVLVPLANKKYEVMQMLMEQEAVYAGRIRETSNLVKNMGHLLLLSNKQGASHATVQGVRSLVNVLTAYHMLGVWSEGKAQLLVQLAFSVELCPIWDHAWDKAATLNPGYGSQLFCTFRHQLVVFTMIAEKQRIFNTKSVFLYSGESFETTRLVVEQLFTQYLTSKCATASS